MADLEFKFWCGGKNLDTGKFYSPPLPRGLALQTGANRLFFLVKGTMFRDTLGVKVPTSETVAVTWNLAVDDNGNIRFKGNPSIKKKEGNLDDDTTFGVKCKYGPDWLTMDASMKFDKSGIDLSVKGVGVKGVGAQRGSDQEQFRFDLNAAKKPAPPAAKKPAPPATPKPKVTKATIVVGSFQTNHPTVKTIRQVLPGMFDYSRLSGWYNKLPEPTLEAIRNGKPPGGHKIVLTGYTDNRGDEHLNFELGRKRAVDVLKTLENISGVKWADIAATPSKGEQDVRQEQKNLEKDEPKHRRVEVEIYVEG